jgi:hypothetical protein
MQVSLSTIVYFAMKKKPPNKITYSFHIKWKRITHSYCKTE